MSKKQNTKAEKTPMATFGQSSWIGCNVKMTTHKAAEFTNAAGETIISFQLLNEHNKAIAIADFRCGKVERFDSTSANLNEAKDWLQDVTACVNNIYNQETEAQ